MDLQTHLMGLHLKNPLMPASGPLVGDATKILHLNKIGLGAMVTKTISSQAAQVPRPCIQSYHDSLFNAELWSEHSKEEWINQYLPAIKKEVKTPLIISVGYTKEDMQVLIPSLDPFADAFEISTHYVGKDLQVIAETIRTIKKLTKKPLFMKMSPHMPSPVDFCKMVLASGGNGIVAINSVGPTLHINLQTRSVEMGNKNGEAWMSGPVIKPIALAIISQIKRALPECTIIGAGGIASSEDVLEFLLAGADAVQMLSAAMLKGTELYGKIIRSLPETLKKYGFSSIQEVIDTPLNIPPVSFIPKLPTFDTKLCILCEKCMRSCPYDALRNRNQTIIVDSHLCFGCALCQSICPTHAIMLR